MKNFLAILTLLYSLPSLSNVCSKAQPQVKLWQAQQNWLDQEVNPSADNPNVSYTLYETSNGDLKIGSMDQGIVTFKASLETQFQNSAKEKLFKENCRDQKVISVLDSEGHGKNPARDGYFKISLPILPAAGADIINPLAKKALVFRANVWVSNDSRSKVSLFPKSASEASDLLEEAINSKIQQQVDNHKNFNGTIEINFDGNDALACDLLTGEAKIKFFHYGENEEKLTRTDVISKAHLSEITEKVTSISPQSTNLSLFTAGVVAQEANYLQNIQENIQDLESILLLLFNKPIVSPVLSDEISCALDQTATINENISSFENLFEIEIKEEL